MYQKQSQVIRQALELEDEAQRFEMYLASGVEEEADTGKKTDMAGVSSVQEPDKQREQSEKMDSSVVDYNIDLAATPVLHEVIDAKLDGHADTDVRDVVVIQSPNIQVTLFADFNENRLRSIYQRGKRTCSSTLQVAGKPWSIAVINEGMVAVSSYVLYHIITVAVTPDLELSSTIQTSKIYWGLCILDQSTLVAGCKDPPSVDLIDMKGTILKTFTTLPAIGQSFIDPHYIHVTRQGTILVSDYGLKSVICLSRSGDIVFTYAPTGDRALRCTYGITSISTGDVLVADCWAHKVIHLSKTGDYIRDILTEDDGLLSPTGLCVDGDKLCVALVMKGVHKYKFRSN